MKSISINKKRNDFLIPFFLFTFLIVLPLLANHSYFMHIMIMTFIYAIMAEAWNILGGYTGQISLGNAMFFGVGAYTSTVLLIYFKVNPWIGMLLGGIFAIILAILIGFPVFRLKGHYFVIATLAAGEIIMVIFLDWDYVKGARGLELPLIEDSLKGMNFLYNKIGFYYIGLGILTIFVVLFYLITKSKFGYYFKTIRENESSARSIGINTTVYKLVALSITAFFTAIAGTVYAQYMLYIDPPMVFTFTLSVKIVLIAALGGSGTILGPILGAFILIPTSEMARVFFGGGGQGIDLIFYGALIMIIALFKPDGLITLFQKNN